MTAISFLAEWAVRSAVLILGGGLLLWALRVKAASIRLAAWTALLGGSLAIPALTLALPKMALPAREIVVAEVGPLPVVAARIPPVEAATRKTFDWARVALIIYALGAGTLLLRLGTGLTMSIRMRRSSRTTGEVTEGIEIRESDLLLSPVTLGIVQPTILLPGDWRQWEGAKLDAVLAHERSHIRRGDPAVQLLSAMHRALYWFSPASWLLHQRLVRVAEEASDDAAVEATRDRSLYAKVLLEFMERGGELVGVPMGRYSRPDARIDRILEGTSIPPAVKRRSVAILAVLGLPLAYLAAAAGPGSYRQVVQEPVPSTLSEKLVQPQLLAAIQKVTAPQPKTDYLRALGAVTPFATVTVKSHVDGELMSVNFKEGDMVQAGQTLATVDPRPYQLQLAEAEAELTRERAHLIDAPFGAAVELYAKVKLAKAKVNAAKLQLSYTEIQSPITGVAGLRLVDAGNIVRAADSGGIVVINQLRPISVVFSISEDQLPKVIAHLKDGLAVEAWSRNGKTRLATGRLEAVDNQIDTATGMLKLKSVFENEDSALFPNQFVNVRLMVGTN